MRIAVECFVDAPPDVAFAAATDVSNWPRFNSGVQGIELLTPGTLAAGTCFRETRSMFGRQATEDMTLAQIEPPRRFLLTAFNHGTAYRAISRIGRDGPESFAPDPLSAADKDGAEAEANGQEALEATEIDPPSGGACGAPIER